MFGFIKHVIIAIAIMPWSIHAFAIDCPDGYIADGNTCVELCDAGYWRDNGQCVKCGTAGKYCPGDNIRYDCPPYSSRLVPLWQSKYPNMTESSTGWYLDTSTSKEVSDCIMSYYIKDNRALMHYKQRYNPATDKYDTFYAEWLAYPYAGYYLTQLSTCPSVATWKAVEPCIAGGYCPGKTASYDTCSIKPDTYGLEVCPDNSYSDAGASSCTPCPAGTGNSGSNLSDHAGVSSCKTISCPAGQEVVNYVCTACKAGYYKSSAGSASCTQCSDYKYASGTGNTSCVLPPAGYNSTGCSSGKGCTGQEPCGTSWYCPGDGRYYSCPSNSTARTNTSTSADDCLCNSGYVKRSGECKQLCTAGFTTLNSNGVTVNAYADKLTTPAINISANGKTCYVPLASGSASGAINVSYDSKMYHTVN